MVVFVKGAQLCSYIISNPVTETVSYRHESPATDYLLTCVHQVI